MTVPTLHFVPGRGDARRAPQRLADLSPAAAQLARLVPAVYLARNDTVPGRPLLTLLEVLGEQLAALDRAVTTLADDRFVERASPAALGALAELVGARLTGDDPQRWRAVVGRTLHWRRRKGTLATLEDVLTFTSGWSAEVDEAYRSLLLTQDLARPQTWRGRTAVLWDPVALADPLTRRSRGARSSRDAEPDATLARRPDEDVEQTLRRVGAVDAGRYAASPRTVDLLGWARPDRAVIRTDRMVTAELDGLTLPLAAVVTHRSDPSVVLHGYRVDPLGRDRPLIGRFPLRSPDEAARLTAAHEPDPSGANGAERFRDGVLTPTGLAHDPDGTETADTISVFVDGVRLVGPPEVAGGGAELAFAPVGPSPTLRLADASRPTGGQEWDLRAYALESTQDVPTRVLPDVAPAGDRSPLVLATRVRRGQRDTVDVREAARVPRGGAGVALRVARTAGDGTGWRRAADGTWSPLTCGPRTGPVLSPVTLVEGLPAGPTLVRLERAAGGGCTVARWVPGDPASRWTSAALDLGTLADADLPDVDPPAAGPALALAAHAAAVLLIAPVRDDNAVQSPGLGLWRITGVDGAPAIERLDAAAARRPGDRLSPGVLVDADRLVLHGGRRAGRVLDDTWSVPLTGADAGSWRAHTVRHRVRRVGGTLVPTPAGIVLVGGASVPGELDPGVFRVDLTRPRPSWTRLADLPVPAATPGVLLARPDPTASGAGVQVLAWIDTVAPVLLRSDEARGWRAGPVVPGPPAAAPAPEAGAPDPPADGEAVAVGDDWVIAGPPPLPPSEVVVTVGGTGRLAFLPALDPAPGEAAAFTLFDDGSTRRWLPDGEPERDELRLGAGRAASAVQRTAPGQRVGVPGRLSWTPLRLQQVSLEPWDRPVALTLPDAVGVDPRLGRLLVRSEIADGPVTATVRFGRSGRQGPGFAPAGGRPPAAWILGTDELTVSRPPIAAWVSPDRAGLASPDGPPIAPQLVDGLVAASADLEGGHEDTAPVLAVAVAVVGSPRLAPATLAAGQDDTVAIVADPGTRPHLTADTGVSLTLRERLAGRGGEDPDEGPSWLLDGLSTAGTVELAVSAGRLDVRWCSVGQPGAVAVRVAGAGYAGGGAGDGGVGGGAGGSPGGPDGLVRHSLPRPRVAVRLVGCELGALQVPPWTDVLAVGCTFDAGDPDGVAIAAAGAGVRLRHCTVHGRTVAGVLRASSAVLAGPVVTDRPDLGWLRYCVSPGTGRAPLAFRSLTGRPSFVSLRPADPDYLRLDVNNGPAVLRAAEQRRTPGAHHDLADRIAELDLRTDEFLPLALAPFHVDHAVADLVRIRRSR